MAKKKNKGISTKKVLRVKKAVKKLRSKGDTVVRLKVKDAEGGKKKYLVKRLQLEVTTEDHVKEVRFQTYDPASKPGSFKNGDFKKLKTSDVKSLKPKRFKAKKVKKEKKK